jgi:hypothetical protein
MRNPSWFAFQALQGALCGLAGWMIAPSVGTAMLLGPMILFLFWLLESVLAFRGNNIYVPSADERGRMQDRIEDGEGPFIIMASMGLLFLGGSAAAGLPAAVCSTPLEAVLVGTAALFTVWGLMYFLPSMKKWSSRA